MGDAMWLLVAALALACAVLVWLLLRRRRPDSPPVQPEAPAAPPPPVVARTASVVPPVAPPEAARPSAAPPPPAQAVAPAPGPAPGPAPAPATVVAPPSSGRAPRTVPTAPSTVVERAARFVLRDDPAQPPVLLLERAAAAAWEGAAALEPTPMQRDALAALLAHADRLDAAPGSEAGGDLFVVRLRADTALPLARGELSGPPGGELQSEPPLALDAAGAASFAAIMLALHCGPAYLSGLRARVSETKSMTAALHPKLAAQGDGKLKALLQDLTRYLREAEENYAGAIRKPVFIARVGDTCTQAEALWRAVGDGLTAARAQLETQAAATRFGEVQLEKSLAALRELQGQRRVQDVAARILAGWHLLRLALGEASPGAAAVLGGARDVLRDAQASDAALAERLRACLDGAKVPDYVGKAEFVANRTAARELLQKIEAESLQPAVQYLAQVVAAIDAGFSGRAALGLLLRLDAQRHAVELRVAA